VRGHRVPREPVHDQRDGAREGESQHRGEGGSGGGGEGGGC
jgi:hypothetical protein